MAKIKMLGWTEGLKKVSLAELQNSLLSISFKEAKENVDKLLSDNSVEINIDDHLIATRFVEEALGLGVICVLED
jgi:hypothetical protein